MIIPNKFNEILKLFGYQLSPTPPKQTLLRKDFFTKCRNETPQPTKIPYYHVVKYDKSQNTDTTQKSNISIITYNSKQQS